MTYPFGILLRRSATLMKCGLQNGSLLSLFDVVSFLFFYWLFTYTGGDKKAVKIKTKTGNINLRTRTSDLEVFIQHFVYCELFPIKEKPGNTKYILDAGANIGLSTLIFADLFPQSIIVAIELEESNFQLLKNNCHALIEGKRVIPILGAYYPYNTNSLNIVKNDLSEWSYRVDGKEKETKNGIPVRTVTYDEVSAMLGNKFPDLVKMDIEGSERDFFAHEAGRSMLLNSSVMVELHGFGAHQEYFSLLKSAGLSEGIKIGEFWTTIKS